MMPPLNTRLNALVTSLTQALPNRHITRSFKDHSMWQDSLLVSGLWQLLSDNGSDYNGELSLAGGIHNLLLIGFIRVEDDTEPEVIEKAELSLLEEFGDFLDSDDNCGLEMLSWQQSKQLEHPYGWVLVSLAWSDI